jgi:hypothetical protein
MRAYQMEQLISKDVIEKARSPRGLRQLVTRRITKVCGFANERHEALRKKGIYKVFSDEIIPLSLFCLKTYPNTYTVQPVIGNQGYDAIVRDEKNNIFDHIELTLPHDGYSAANNARLVVERGHSEIDVYSPGENLNRMFSLILKACQNKSIKDYSNCSLVVCLNFSPPFPEHKKVYLSSINKLLNEISNISFHARKVYLLVMPFNKVIDIFG